MGYLLYSLTLSVLIVGTILIIFRSRWLHLVPLPEHIYHRLPTTFHGDAELGLSSADFNLASNIVEGDNRGGLDERGKREVLKIMRSQRVDFNEARKIYMEKRFAKNNIGPDGMPKDPKFVSFS
ncbi:hypothetical protein LOZ53_006354 [Ophidiomyces ophidiicola]|uniref:Uncharacterized protein n=1 Tax=Ophidiomyces ophidiicola TaxID=1387563 RepID=A0ACB8UPL9_9EURO|nr:hypothetical protein LOZ61_006590 [Ophidiomyces ophidiicola]KAI1916577.1 hypothetical protein LOZ64_003327 [Ophidiomyces ophidiicola]KAI1921190.1 hypothetical protein LOZ60_006302 [Ophidiomyces ophidiicola]KAI1947581.1 hypothetical protein LOZ62_002944 [Ophidiomyces ophidiicola]KAI1957606.1 hypothetical protein LOZ59_003821 [Ophidiomyces ophidiicola]